MNKIIKTKKYVLNSRSIGLRVKETEKLIQCLSTGDAEIFFKGIWGNIKDKHREHFIVMALDNNLNTIGYNIMSSGGVSGTVADIKLIFTFLLSVPSCTNFIVSHNHPAGNTKPSADDLDLTSKLKEAGVNLDIKLIDHVIYTEKKLVSMLEEGYIK